MAAVKALQQWCKIKCEGYKDVSITNMTTSFRDGLAFCALLHKHRPDLINFDLLSKENVYENNQLAFQVAEKELGIPALLDAEDMVALKVPDRLSILTYVSQYYNYFHGRSPIGGLGGVKRPAEVSKDEPSGKKNPPATTKTFPLPKPTTEIKPPILVIESKQDIPSERFNKSGTLSSSCSVCSQHVHLVQRHLVDGKLYHRNCFKCRECSTILLSGTYKTGKLLGTFICKTHTSMEKPPATHIIARSPKTYTTGNHKTDHNTSKLDSLANKSDQLVTRGTATPSTPTYMMKTAKTSTPETTCKVLNPRAATQALKPVSNSVQKNLEARNRFFESTSSPSTSSVSPASSVSHTSTRSVSPGGVKAADIQKPGKNKVLLRVDDWTKSPVNEKEKAIGLIGRMVAEEKNNNSLSSSRVKANGSQMLAKESDAKGPSARGRLKPLDTSVEIFVSPGTPSWMKDKASPRSTGLLSSSSKENETAPSDWRAMLKPISKTANGTENTGSSPKRPEVVSSPQTSLMRISQPREPASSTTTLSKNTVPPRVPVLTPLKNGTRCGDSRQSSSFSPAVPSGPQTHKSHKPDYIPKEAILNEMQEIETNLNVLEKKGIVLEKQLRQCDDEGEEDTSMNELMVDWFNLIRNKQVYIRRESELVYIARAQDLEEQQLCVESELRGLMEKPARVKTSRDHQREKDLMDKLVEIVNDRNAIVDGLDEDRLREEEEDEQLNKMLQTFDIKKNKVKRKSSISKWFGRKSKEASAED